MTTLPTVPPGESGTGVTGGTGADEQTIDWALAEYATDDDGEVIA